MDDLTNPDILPSADHVCNSGITQISNRLCYYCAGRADHIVENKMAVAWSR